LEVHREATGEEMRHDGVVGGNALGVSSSTQARGCRVHVRGDRPLAPSLG
jgi:hypothetical protein